MKIYNTTKGLLIEEAGSYYISETGWDRFINQDDLFDQAREVIGQLSSVSNARGILKDELLPPVGSQEVWAAGVTYMRSREARMEESGLAGGGDFYDRVYHANRPELFFKANPERVIGPGGRVNVRKDSKWTVPEPELTLLISANARIIGYTVGNDLSARDLEGENPLYLPQAKTYDGSAALGPCVWVTENEFPEEGLISMEIIRGGEPAFSGEVSVSRMTRKFTELVEFLFRETSFPQGCYLMTGTGIVPPDNFTLQKDDEVRITIDPIGTLVNTVG